MSVPTCPSCGAKRINQERRPNGNATCERGHTHPASSFHTPPITVDGKYREAIEGPLEGLAGTLAKYGLTDPTTDAAMIELAARKFEMLADMVLATGMSPNLLTAALKG